MPDSPRMIFENQGGMVTVEAPDLITQGKYAYLQNTRKLLGGRIVARPPISATLIGCSLPSGVTSVTRLNDPYFYDSGAVGYAFIEGAGAPSAGGLYITCASGASGLSANPLSFLPYRPTGPPRPWCYVADSGASVSIPSYIASGYGLVAG